MIDAAQRAETRSIVVDEVFPHSAAAIWKALTTGDLIGKWLMVPTGFEPVPGNRFTFQTTPAGAWDGVINCEVLEVVPGERFAFAWKGGHEGNDGYGSRLDTVVTFILSPAADGTRLRLVHAGFVPTKNDHAFNHMSEGWKSVVRNVGATAAGLN